MRERESHGFALTGYGEMRGGIASGLMEPCVASAKIVEQGMNVHSRNFARPHDFGVIDVRAVINPFAAKIMSLPIAHNREFFAGHGLEFERRSARGFQLARTALAPRRSESSAPH